MYVLSLSLRTVHNLSGFNIATNAVDVEDVSMTREELRRTARSTFSRLREETRGLEEEGFVTLGLGRYELLIEGNRTNAVKYANESMELNEELRESASLLRETCLSEEEEEEPKKEFNLAAHYDQRGDFEIALELWSKIIDHESGKDDNEITAKALVCLGRRLCLEGKELDRADEVLQRAMRYYATTSDKDKINLSYTLAWLGAIQHACEKAVTAEGLLRSATDTMESVRDTMNLQELFAYCEALDVYARLLSDWEKREREAQIIKSKSDSLREQHSSLLISPCFDVGGSWWDSDMFLE